MRLSARKARLVLDHIRGRSVPEARTILAFTPRAAAVDIEKVLRSAVANAESTHALDGDELVILAAYADEGPTLKRWRPRARGRATRIRKRTCHITVVVARYSPDELARLHLAASGWYESQGRPVPAIDQIKDLKNKKVFIRVDFNVPQDDKGAITEDDLEEFDTKARQCQPPHIAAVLARHLEGLQGAALGEIRLVRRHEAVEVAVRLATIGAGHR